MNNLTISPTDQPLVQFLTPSELLGMFTSYLSQQEANRQVIFLKGIYLKNPKHNPQWQSRYDILRDESTQTEITLQIPLRFAENLKDGNLVTVGGVLGRRVQNNSHIQILLVVSRIDVVQDQAIDEDEMRRIELRRIKAAAGFRNVDTILENSLYNDQRPRIALIFAQGSITDSDFKAGVEAARANIDFDEYRATFSRTDELIKVLDEIDADSYDAVAVVRGGGAGLEVLNALPLLERVVNLHTPIIAAVGHPDEKIFFKQLVDKEVAVPNDLGHYFKNMVESVTEQKTRSRAQLTEKIKKQFQEQLEAGQKQNKELQEKLTALTKTQEETTKKQAEIAKLHDEQVKAAHKQNEELQKQLKTITEEQSKKQAEMVKLHEEQVKTANKQNEELQKQLKTISEQNEQQTKKFNESLKAIQETNGNLQKSLEKANAQSQESLKQMNQSKDQVLELQRKLDAAQKPSSNTALYACIAIIAVLIVTVIALLIN